MKCKIQYIKQSFGTAIMEPPKYVVTDEVGIGRATTQDIYLADASVALEHASINEDKRNRFTIQALAGVPLDVNGKLVEKARIKEGDVIKLGPYVVTLFPAESDCDIYLYIESYAVAEKQAALQELEVKEVAPQATLRTKKMAMQLSETKMSKRRWSWLAVLTIITLFVVVPVALLDLTTPSAATVLLPSDQAWNPGRLSHVHQHFGDDCEVCHEQPFVRVTNQACVACHTDTFSHAHTPDNLAKVDLRLVEKGRCAACHKEHNGSLSLRPGHQDICSNCHAELDALSLGGTELLNASDFGDAHPEFRPKVQYGGQWSRQAIGSPLLVHQGGLKFSHAEHMHAEGMATPDGTKVLACSDCHEAEPGGAYILPVNMERHCQACHQLNFDPALPERVVPHADLEGLVVFLNEFYALQALQGGYRGSDAPASVKRRRRPNDRVTGQQQQSALRWARGKAQTIAREIVEQRTCAVCHTVTVDDSKLGWRLDAVYDPTRWMDKALFDHGKHDKQACVDCHAAEQSTSAEDVLLPGIENCRACHAGARAKDRYASTCVSCHQFHKDGNPTYGYYKESMMAKPKIWYEIIEKLIINE